MLSTALRLLVKLRTGNRLTQHRWSCRFPPQTGLQGDTGTVTGTCDKELKHWKEQKEQHWNCDELNAPPAAQLEHQFCERFAPSYLKVLKKDIIQAYCVTPNKSATSLENSVRLQSRTHLTRQTERFIPYFRVEAFRPFHPTYFIFKISQHMAEHSPSLFWVDETLVRTFPHSSPKSTPVELPSDTM